jgi:hypothetical protein
MQKIIRLGGEISRVEILSVRPLDYFALDVEFDIRIDVRVMVLGYGKL